MEQVRSPICGALTALQRDAKSDPELPCEVTMFVVLEGLDGAGTTTQLALLSARLEAEGIDHLCTREPTGRLVGRTIRQILAGKLLRPDGSAFDAETLALLFATDRLDHLTHLIEPALAHGKWVISDRYVHSSLAYQGMEVDRHWVAKINAQARPADLVVWLDLDPEACMERVAARGGERDIFETAEKLRLFAEGYAQSFALRSDPWVKVSGEGSREEVATRIWDAVSAACPS
jgi:dTMP kinase